MESQWSESEKFLKSAGHPAEIRSALFAGEMPCLSCHTPAHTPGSPSKQARTMRLIRAAIVLAALGVILCLWLLVRVSWYNFVAFMLLAQPLLLIAALIFLATAVKELRQKGVL